MQNNSKTTSNEVDEAQNQAKCDNCHHTFPYSSEDLSKIRDLASRLDTGGTVPAAECPKCGCLAYPIFPKKAKSKNVKNRAEMAFYFMGKSIYFTYVNGDRNKCSKYIYSTDDSGSETSDYAFDVRNLFNVAVLNVDIQENHSMIMSDAIANGRLKYPPEVSVSDHIRQEHAIRLAMGHLEEDTERLQSLLPKFIGDKINRNGLELCGFLMERTQGMLELILTNSLD